MKWKFQFSLSSLLWLTVCCALLLTSVLMYRRMAIAERDSAILRKDAGYLAVSDEKLFHAVSVKTYDPFAWRWRLFIPPKHKLVVKAMSGDIPAEGMPDLENMQKTANGIEGESILNVALRQDKNDRWMLYITMTEQNGQSQKYEVLPLSDSATKIITQSSYGSTSTILGEGGAVSQTVEKPIILLKHQFLKSNPTSTPKLSPGITIWLEEQK
jgi:hypothetical protein